MFGCVADLSQSVAIQSGLFSCKVRTNSREEWSLLLLCLISQCNTMTIYDLTFFRQYFVNVDDTVAQKVLGFFKI